MLDTGMVAGAAAIIAVPAGLQNIVEADQVALDIDIRMIDRVTNACLSSQVHHNSGLVFGKYLIHQCLVCDRAADEDMLHRRSLRRILDQVQTVFLQCRIIVVAHIVKTDHSTRVHFIQKAEHQICTDESGGTSNQDRLTIQLDMQLAHD